MAQIIFVRHGESSANVAQVLAGRTPGVELTQRGRSQAQALAPQLRALAPDIVLRSTLHRCAETAALAMPGLSAAEEPAFDEVDYGDWSGQKLATLGTLPQWRGLLADPCAMHFPAGESLHQANTRTVAGIARVVEKMRSMEQRDREAAAGDDTQQPNRTAVVFSHGDIVKFALLDALGIGLAGLHRLTVATGSMSVVDYNKPEAPMVCAVSVSALGANTTRGTLGG